MLLPLPVSLPYKEFFWQGTVRSGVHVLDLLLTTHPDLVSCVQIINSLPRCDHDAVHFSLAAKIPKQSAVKRTLYNYYYYYQSFTMQQYRKGYGIHT